MDKCRKEIMQMKHQLTVLLTIFNIAEYLPRFFECMQKQTFSDYCLLIIDDGSIDDSLEICRRFAENDDRIEIFSVEHVGISQARNIGIQKIETPLTAFVDGDDYFEDDYLKHLVESLEKYNADLSISRVEYIKEGEDTPVAVHPERGETLIKKDEFNEKLPSLLRDRRLNYLYAKMFRSYILKQLRVEEDVKQGSDTMFVFQYLDKARSIVLTDDIDYHYIKYQKRAVTSYSGRDAFDRLLRINNYIRDFSESHNMMTDELLAEIDGRIMISGVWVIEKIMYSDEHAEKKAEEIDKILNNEYYIESYERQKDHLDQYAFEPIKPQSGSVYFKNKTAQENLMALKGKVSKRLPYFVMNLYRAIRR